jgi:hypothetical protein
MRTFLAGSYGLLCVLSGCASNPVFHSFQETQLTSTFYSEGVAVADINKDGALDIISGPYWYAGPDFQRKFAYYLPVAFDPLNYSNNFLSFVYDFNHDGWPDILVINFPGQDASWFENPQGRDELWTKHQVIDVVAAESPAFVDVNGDGRPDLIYISQDGRLGWAAFDPIDPAKPWIFHPISPPGYSSSVHGLGVGDVNGDGRPDILEANGWWEQPSSLVNDPTWIFHSFAFGPGAQISVADMDGDGLNDVVNSLNAHGYGLAWYQQVQQGNQISFCKHLILNTTAEPNRYGVAFSELHSVAVLDIDGDGVPDIVTGKRHWAHGPTGDVDPNGRSVLYWFRTVRSAQGVDFVPYLIESDSGVGTQIFAGDVDGDGLPDIVVGSKLGTFFMRQQANAVTEQELDAAQPQAQLPFTAACQQ